MISQTGHSQKFTHPVTVGCRMVIAKAATSHTPLAASRQVDSSVVLSDLPASWYWGPEWLSLA